MDKFKKYQKQAVDLHTKKVEQREQSERQRKERAAQRKKEDDLQDKATIKELSDEEAQKLQSELDEV